MCVHVVLFWSAVFFCSIMLCMYWDNHTVLAAICPDACVVLDEKVETWFCIKANNMMR